MQDMNLSQRCVDAPSSTMLRAVVDRSSSRSNSQSPAGNPDPESNDLHSSFGSEVTTPRLKQWLSKKNFGHHERVS